MSCKRFRLIVSTLSTGALVKTDEQEVINFLLTTEIIPLCLRIMESGSELSKTVLWHDFVRNDISSGMTFRGLKTIDTSYCIQYYLYVNWWKAKSLISSFSMWDNCLLGCHLHPTEDSPGWHRAGIHLSNVWALLPRCYDSCESAHFELLICNTFVSRFSFWPYSLSLFQGKMVLQLSKEPSARLLKHVVRWYLRLSDNSRYLFFHR